MKIGLALLISFNQSYYKSINFTPSISCLAKKKKTTLGKRKNYKGDKTRDKQR